MRHALSGELGLLLHAPGSRPFEGIPPVGPSAAKVSESHGRRRLRGSPNDARCGRKAVAAYGQPLDRHRDRRQRQRHLSETRELLRGLALGYCFARQAAVIRRASGGSASRAGREYGRCPARTGDLLLVRREHVLPSAGRLPLKQLKEGFASCSYCLLLQFAASKPLPHQRFNVARCRRFHDKGAARASPDLGDVLTERETLSFAA